ncbi:MAG: hypothetical protein WBM17_00385 [Anaerolineales bacterium]
MSSTPRLNRFLFTAFILLSLCVGSAALVWEPVRVVSYAPLRDALLPNFYLNPQAGKPVTLILAAPPALEDWIRDASVEFSRLNPLVTVNLTILRGAEASTRLTAMTGLPDIWIAESDWARIAAGGIPFEPSGTVVAQDTFIWAASAGAPQNVLTGLNWKSLAQVAATDSQFRLAVPPEGSVEGMGACLSAAAEFFQQSTLTAEQINDPAFKHWLAGLLQAVSDRTKNPYDQMTSRPPQAEAAFLPLSDSRRLNASAFILQVPAYRAVLNYTFFIRSNWREIENWEADLQQAAAKNFLSYLLRGGPQGNLADQYLERPDAVFENPVRPADENAVYALQFCWGNQGGNT